MNRKEIAILSLITFLTAVVWISFNLYHAQKTSTVTHAQQEQVAPLTPTFDNETINKLKNREE